MSESENKIAIVGMAGQFPGADSVEKLWLNVVRPGAEVVTRFATPEGPVGYGVLSDAAMFDNAFFDMTPAEAQRVTPQHRLFLEATWHAIESAGMDLQRFKGHASVYASTSISPASYLRRILEATRTEALSGAFDLLLGNAEDTLATRVGYKLGLRGECITVQTHCSSSLVAVHLACQSLLSGTSDVSIAGGVSVRFSVEADQEEELALLSGRNEGFILSRDAQCRALLDGATGAISGDGVAVVVLKRLEDALRDGNTIFATIAGTGINNDGRNKIGFTAPSVEGVTGVIDDALAFAGVDPGDVGYIECHGTGTELGDAIELRSLRKIFDDSDDSPLYLGSIKSNIGHLAAGAGAVGLIKAALALYNKAIPPLAHARDHAPHSEITLSNRLAVPTEYLPWEVAPGRRRHAGVTSLGIGGTNVHVLLEEAPTPSASTAQTRPVLLPWSAKTPKAANELTRKIHAAIDLRRDFVSLPDAAYTLQRGRTGFPVRRCVAAESLSDALGAFESGAVMSLPHQLDDSARMAFVFSGYGVEKPGMAAEYLRCSQAFRVHVRECAAIVRPWLDFDLEGYLERSDFDASALGLAERGLAIVTTQWSLARCYMAWGVTPEAVIGSSLGEYTAAAVSGHLSLHDMLRLVEVRGRLLDSVRGGAMVLVDQSWEQLTARAAWPDDLERGIDVAAGYTIVSGPRASVEALEVDLKAEGKYARVMPVDVAFHSKATEAIGPAFKAEVRTLRFASGSIRLASNVSGTWFSPDASVSDYWFEQMRQTVKFQQGLKTLWDDGVRLFFEVGAGTGMAKFAEWNFGTEPNCVTRSSATHAKSDRSDWCAVCEVVGTAWMQGRDIDWKAFGDEGRLEQLPTYPFQRRFFYLGEPIPEEIPAEEDVAGGFAKRRDADRQMPRNFLEEQVATIWSAILGVRDIGIDENFFDLGGDSLQATRVLGKIQVEIASDIGVEDIMQYRTIREISALLESMLTADEPQTASGESEYYCSFEMDFGGFSTTIFLTKDEFDANGIPDGAQNIKILGS